MKIAIGSDHGGYGLKEQIKQYLVKTNYQVEDIGCHAEERCDYPDFGFAVAAAVGRGDCDRGILICKSGIGMSIVANKVKGVRAALCLNALLAEKSRRHNDANVLVFGAEFVAIDNIENILDTWLKTEFDGGRHQLRLDKIIAYENNK